MTEFDYLRIIKWTIIVLLAGFIGQFGKSLAKHLMKKARLKKEGLLLKAEETTCPTDRGPVEDTCSGAKGLPSGAVQEISPEETVKQAKKLAKTLAKQRKKEAKAFKKRA